MGNQASANRKEDIDIGCKKLKIEEYPLSISENQWIPTDFQIISKQNKEVLITESVDRRTRAEPHDYEQLHDEKKEDDEKDEYTNPIYNIVRLTTQYTFMPRNKISSGVIIHHTLNKSYILAAAHDIVFEDEDEWGKLLYAETVSVEITQNTSNGFKILNRYCCGGFKVHPKYIKYIKKHHINESETGYDIAVIEV
eukprot:50149_1